MSFAPLISVVIVYWNSEEHLPVCFSALEQQTFKDFEIVLVDNGSEKPYDGKLPKNCSLIKRLDENTGFAFGNNLGVHLANGKWIALLNADAFPEPDWLANLIHSAEQNPDFAVFSSRQIQYHAPDRLDGAGDSYHITGLAWRRFYNRPGDEYGNIPEEVFSACPAAALYSRDKFLEVGGFDEDYFSYFEDVDLGFRLRIYGTKCLYVPEAVVHHVGSASTGRRSDFSVFYGYRNMIWTFFKNMPFPYIWFFLPVHLSAVFFFGIFLTYRKQGRVIWKAIFDAFRSMPKTLAKRRRIQKNMKVRPSDVVRIISTGLLEPYQEFAKRNLSK
jgi:GT2 family glycosyltransferase